MTVGETPVTLGNVTAHGSRASTAPTPPVRPELRLPDERLRRRAHASRCCGRDGYERSATADEADLIVINTCAIREKAEAKVASSAPGAIEELKEQRPGVVVAIGGCVAQQEGERLLKRIPVADFTFGPDQIPVAARRCSSAAHARAPRASPPPTSSTSRTTSFLDAEPRLGEVPVTALVTIQKGCDNHCAFCVVPATRGREVSRPAARGGGRGGALRRRRRARGHAHRPERQLVSRRRHAPTATTSPSCWRAWTRCRASSACATRPRTRRTSRAVADAFRDLRTLCAWLHLPVQSGCSRTLKRMVRDYTRDQYLAQDRICESAVPRHLALDRHHRRLSRRDRCRFRGNPLAARAASKYDSIYSFEYSERPDTPALKLALRDNVPAEVKARAAATGAGAAKAGSPRERLSRFVGRNVEVLVEGDSRAVRRPAVRAHHGQRDGQLRGTARP